MTRTRVYVVGAGPAGISAAIWTRRLGLEPVVLERKTHLGGQLADYSLPITDMPGIPQIGGQALMDELQEQLRRLAIGVEYGCQAVDFRNHQLSLADGTKLTCRGVIYAPGVRTRTLEAPGAEAIRDVSASQILNLPERRGLDILVVGGGDRAVEAAIRLAESGLAVRLVHRRSRLRARASFRQRLGQSGADVLLNTVVAGVARSENGRLHVQLVRGGDNVQVEVSHVLVRIGMEPDLLSPLAEAALNMPQTVRLAGDAVESPAYRSLATAFASGMRAAKGLILSWDG